MQFWPSRKYKNCDTSISQLKSWVFFLQYNHEEMKKWGSQMFISSARVTKRYKNINVKSGFSVF